MRTLGQLRRIRWAVRATLTLAVAASTAANVLHALDDPVARTIAAWPPVALLITIELISRVPVHRRHLAAARLAAATGIAGIAAYVSYIHMVAVASRYGEAGAAPFLIPLSVDGLVVVASICLVELGGRIRQAEQAGALQDAPGQDQDNRPGQNEEPDEADHLQAAARSIADELAAEGRTLTRDELARRLRTRGLPI